MQNKKFECSAVLNWCEIELTNYCWLDCFGCIRKESNSFWYLDFFILKKIIKLIKNKKYSEIVLSGLWDVFLHKQLYIFIDYIFYELPNIKIYIMTKWQSVKKKDIDKILTYKNNWFNLWLTYSIFSLSELEYEKITGWWSLNNLVEIIKYSYDKKINFSFEFLINNNNIYYIEKYKKFCSIFSKDFFYSIPHNWWWNLNKLIYNKLFDKKILNNIIKKRKEWEKCEAFIWKYLFFDYSWNIYKCWLQRFSNNLFLWNINNIKSEKDFIKINYNKCEKCSYFNYKTKIW